MKDVAKHQNISRCQARTENSSQQRMGSCIHHIVKRGRPAQVFEITSGCEAIPLHERRSNGGGRHLLQSTSLALRLCSRAHQQCDTRYASTLVHMGSRRILISTRSILRLMSTFCIPNRIITFEACRCCQVAHKDGCNQ